VLTWRYYPRPASGNGIWTDSGTGDNASNGWSIHSLKSREVKRFHLRKARRFDIGHMVSHEENIFNQFFLKPFLDKSDFGNTISY
jgi:hypothetical protein